MTRSVCLSWSGRAEFEEVGRSVPDSASEVDIWEGWMKEGKKNGIGAEDAETSSNLYHLPNREGSILQRV
jgi:hypothetical protein